MATANRNRTSLRAKTKNLTDFSKVGGLSNHIKLLREIIIFPLLYGDVYRHFGVKAPRGVLFFGPPGTGKTLVAGALAAELNKEGNGKVTFYQRQGGDILDKWVGESERKLRDLFNQATRNRPSIIFFDEVDGLAPVRSQKNDQVHGSVVATLLALMDGLDHMPGVIVIGATNRIDAIDPALRRSGRFDRELYFPLPSVDARKEILKVHTQSWKLQPSNEFFERLAELTSGCCGSDLQALCAESVLCCLKRLYPNIHRPVIGNKIKINADAVLVEEIDFLNARMNLIPTSQRLGNYKVRKLSPFIKPLLQRQLDEIVRRVQILLPQFTQPSKKFLIGSERYAGRLVMKGTNQQGLTVHVIPAILQTLEHLPYYMLDIPALFESNINNARQNLPSILVLSRVDDWWDLIDSSTQLSLVAMLEDLHAGLPLLLIATCGDELPDMLQDYFYSNISTVIQMEDPTVEEREQFFAPLFWGNSELSVYGMLKHSNSADKIVEPKQEANVPEPKIRRRPKRGGKCKRKDNPSQKHPAKEKGTKRQVEEIGDAPQSTPKRSKVDGTLDDLSEVIGRNPGCTKNALKPAASVNGTSKCRQSAQQCANRILEDTAARSDEQLSDSDENMYTSNMYPQDVYAFEGKTGKENFRYSRTDVNDHLARECSRVLDCSSRDYVPRTDGPTCFYSPTTIKQEPLSETSLAAHNSFDTGCYCYGNDEDAETTDVLNLWKRVAHVTSDGLPVGQLELLYDTISACIRINRARSEELIQAIERTLTNFENSSMKNTGEMLDGSID